MKLEESLENAIITGTKNINTCTTEGALTTATKMIDNSFTVVFFERIDACLEKKIPMNNFIIEYCQVKKSFHKKAIGSKYYNVVMDDLYRKYKRFGFEKLFVKVGDNDKESPFDD